MEWNKLLSTKRIRDLFEKGESHGHKGDMRSEFERDYGRAVFSTPLRRLQDKAQVFPLEPLDYVRTRLTHSLEVSSVASGLADRIASALAVRKKISSAQGPLIHIICATCGLIHDLGNPPFGHAGEEAIREWFEERSKDKAALFRGLREGKRSGKETKWAKDFLKFNGNAQTLRLVSKLQVLADPFGLNLTCGTISAAMKYVGGSNEIRKTPHESSKLGYFQSEAELVEMVRRETGTGEHRNPLAHIVEAADDICYCTVDLEDALRKGVLDWQHLEKLLRGNDDRLTNDCLKWAKDLVNKGMKRWIRAPETTPESADVQAFRTAAIFQMTKAAAEAFEEHYDEIMAGEYRGELLADSSARNVWEACKEIGLKHVYCSESISKLEVMGRRVIQELMDIFWDAARDAPHPNGSNAYAARLYALMSSNYRNVFEEAMNRKEAVNGRPIPLQYHRLQLVVDYVSGMTDTFACSLHKQFTNG